MRKSLFFRSVASLLLLVSLSSLSGCVNSLLGVKEDKIKEKPPININGYVLEKVAQYANDIDSHIKKVATLQQESLRKKDKLLKIPETPDYIKNDIYLSKKATIVNWSGPVEPLLEEITAKSHLNLIIKGRHPSNPVIVKLNYIKVPAFMILEDIGLQLGSVAGIKVKIKNNERKLYLIYNQKDFEG